MKFVLAGGSGQVGTILARAAVKAGHSVVVLSRRPYEALWPVVEWDARSIGPWVHQLDGADVVINLAGQSVNCRYTPTNRDLIISSRVESTRAIGEAISQSKDPPSVWLQSSTATIYSHRFDFPNDEVTGILGGDEPNVPDTWRFSIDVARKWESAANEFNLPGTRTVKLRSAMVMSPDQDGVFDVLLRLVRVGLGGQQGNGKQFVSWIHSDDFVRAIFHILDVQSLNGAVNISSPDPLPNAEFMHLLRQAWGTILGLPAADWMIEIGAIAMQTESELILKSRRVIPTLLLQSGFRFDFGGWVSASNDLCGHWKELHRR